MKGIVLMFGLLIGIAQALPVFAKSAVLRMPLGEFNRNVDNCRISNLSRSEQCRQGVQIFTGDIIESAKQPDPTYFKWNDAKRMKLAPVVTKNQYRVVYETPHDLTSALAVFRDFFHFPTKTPHIIENVATRADDVSAVFHPGIEVTVLPKVPIKFTWCGHEGLTFVLKDSKSNTTFKKDVTGKKELLLTPEVMGMQYPEKYSWEVIGGADSRTTIISLLSYETAKKIDEDLEKIDMEKISDKKKLIKKAAYLMFLSDMYPDDFHLDWLSCQILTDSKGELKQVDEEVIIFLKRNVKLTPCQ